MGQGIVLLEDKRTKRTIDEVGFSCSRRKKIAKTSNEDSHLLSVIDAAESSGNEDIIDITGDTLPPSPVLKCSNDIETNEFVFSKDSISRTNIVDSTNTPEINALASAETSLPSNPQNMPDERLTPTEKNANTQSQINHYFSNPPTSCRSNTDDGSLTAEVIDIIKKNHTMLKSLHEKLDTHIPTLLCSSNTTFKQSNKTEDSSIVELKCVKNINEIEKCAQAEILIEKVTELPFHGHLVTCRTCKYFINHGLSGDKFKKTLGGSFAAGYKISEETYKLYQLGNENKNEEAKKSWQNFKQSIIAHHNSGFHLKAVECKNTTAANEVRSIRVTKNIVTVAIANIKSKTAACHFLPALSMVHELGGDVGDIGHSR